MCKYYSNPEELGSVVSRSLVYLIKTKPGIGWIKADKITSEEAKLQIYELQQKVRELEEKQEAQNSEKTRTLSQGEDSFEIQHTLKDRSGKVTREMKDLTWNLIFSKIGPLMISEAEESTVHSHLNSYIEHLINNPTSGNKSVHVITDSFRSILIQFKALGLIEQSHRKRSIKDTGTYWKLTEKGDELLTDLRAIKRKND